MTGAVCDTQFPGGISQGSPGLLHFAGFRFWTASLLPALVGTTLPFWLRPPGFSFRWLGALEFLLATTLVHAGFSFLHAAFEGGSTIKWPKSRLFVLAGGCIVSASLLGLHMNSALRLHRFVPESIFIIYGLSTMFIGVLYVAPPLHFYRRAGGEVVIAEGLGLIPVLGAYLVQVGDITRTVYMASLPLVVATGLWVWMDELITRTDDEKKGRHTMIILFGPRFSGRFVVLGLSVLFCVTLFVAIATASSNPLTLVAVLSLGFMWTIVTVSWTEYANPTRMLKARRSAFMLHLVTCVIIAATSLVTLRN